MRLMHFEKGTGIKYNKTKYMGIWLELNKGDFRKPQGLKWNSNTMKVLGKTYGTISTKHGNKTGKRLEKNARGYKEVGHLQLSLTREKILIN